MTLTDRKLHLIELLLQQYDEKSIQALEQLLKNTTIPKTSFDARYMKGSVLTYTNPFEPTEVSDWEAA